MGYKLDERNSVIAASYWYFPLIDQVLGTALVLRLCVKVIRIAIIHYIEV